MRFIFAIIGFILILLAAVMIAPITKALEPSFVTPYNPDNTFSKLAF